MQTLKEQAIQDLLSRNFQDRSTKNKLLDFLKSRKENEFFIENGKVCLLIDEHPCIVNAKSKTAN